MAKQKINIQDGFLFQNLKEETPLVVELTTGERLDGVLKRFDRFALALEIEDGREILIYKHAVTTIRPVARPADADRPADEE